MKYGTFQPHFKLFWQPLIFQFSQFRFVFFHDPLLFRLTFEIPVNNVSNYARFLCQFEFQRVKFGSYFLEFGSKSGIFGSYFSGFGSKSGQIRLYYSGFWVQIRSNPSESGVSDPLEPVLARPNPGFCRFLSVSIGRSAILYYILVCHHLWWRSVYSLSNQRTLIHKNQRSL